MKTTMILIATLLATGCASVSPPVTATPDYCLRDGATYDSDQCAQYLAWRATSAKKVMPKPYAVSSLRAYNSD
jgi:uncharacterized protein YceK